MPGSSAATELRTNSRFWRALRAIANRTAPIAICRTVDGFQLQSLSRRWEQPDSNVTDLSLTDGFLGSRLELRAADASYVLRGLDRKQARLFYDSARRQWLLSLTKKLNEWERDNPESLAFLDSLLAPSRFLRQSQVDRHRVVLSAAYPQLLGNIPPELKDHPVCSKLPTLIQFLENPAGIALAANANYVEEEKLRSKTLFETIESNPLTDEQQHAVVTDEDHNLVVAAAGSGKTAVIVAKIAHLISQGAVHPSQLLVLAFNRAARDEIRERIATRITRDAAADITVMTFHGLGYSILGAVSQRKPALAKHVGEAHKAAQHIREILEKLCSDSRFERTLFEWFAWHLHEYKSVFEFQSLGDYYKYLEANNMVTLKGERVKSYEELVIANFLFSNGIDYQYEANYEVNTADATHRRYQPDFYLPQSGIYIEHFGVDRSGHTASFVDEKEYRESMEWKRNLHKLHGTDLIETYSYQRREGALLSSLTGALVERQVEFAPISVTEQLDALRQSVVYDRFSGLVATFLQHFKSNGFSQKSLLERAAACSDTERANAFAGIFGPVFDSYQSGMAAANEVDFEDMIREATTLVRRGAYRSSYRYILVDEFQDISVGRANLLQALCAQRAENQLFAVGDDWQSIYRFAGSDISVMRNFSNFFGPTAKSELVTTFRCNEELAEASGKFIEANPAQLPKHVKATRRRNAPAVYIARTSVGLCNPVEECLRRIQRESETADVLVLGRYKHNWPENWRALQAEFARLTLRYHTAHGSKGLEADYVVVVGLSAGKYGFPSEIEDDPLLNLVLAEAEPYVHAEERRLFYVSMTRAKHAVFLIAPATRCSTFVEELESGEYLVECFGEALSARVYCPACDTGVLSVREGSNEAFVGCEHYPRCAYTTNVCPSCRRGIVKVDGQKGVCVSCYTELPICPRCRVGYLIEQTGKFGQFLGCSTYPACGYTRSAEMDPETWTGG